MNILIIGLGSIARKHIVALRKLNIDAKIYALRSNINAIIEDDIENIYELKNLDIQFDFAIISNPTNLHFQYIEQLALLGIPLFIEKPAIHTLENSDRLVKLIEDAKLITYVACNLRFNPCIEFLKNRLVNGRFRINELNVYCGSYLPDWRPGKDFRSLYSANANMGGGVHLDLFHELDYVTWLFGMPKTSYLILRSKSSLEIDAIDYANYTLDYDNFTASIILNYYRRKSKRVIEIVLQDDVWLVDLLKNEINNEEGKILFKAKNFVPTDTYSSQLDYFIGCLKKGFLPMNTLKESIEILKICLNE